MNPSVAPVDCFFRFMFADDDSWSCNVRVSVSDGLLVKIHVCARRDNKIILKRKLRIQ